MPDVQWHRLFVKWMDSIVDPRSEDFLGEECWAIRQGIDELIGSLEASDGPLDMPQGKQLVGTRIDFYELRWPPRSRGSGPSAMFGVPVIRVLYGYVRPVLDPITHDVAVILLGGNKSPMASRWYDTAVPEAERRIVQWCHEHLAFVPRASGQ